jgi:hypothetical protein
VETGRPRRASAGPVYALNKQYGLQVSSGQVPSYQIFTTALCRRSTSLADAGRKLFAATRTRRSTQNDSDRLRKYLARFDLDWAAIADIHGRQRSLRLDSPG